MSQQDTQPNPKPPQRGSSGSGVIVVEFSSSTPAKPLPLHVRERIRREVVDSYAVDREIIAKVKQLAIHLGRQKADLICEGLALVLEKYRDKLDELLAAQPPGDAPKAGNGPPSP